MQPCPHRMRLTLPACSFDDTICPVDFPENGQITSGQVSVPISAYPYALTCPMMAAQLHRAIVSPMNPEARLTILFDCCHSGSACELPYVYRPDADGNINLMDQLKKGVSLVRSAHQLIQGGWSRDKVADAKMLLGGATDFFNGLHHLRDGGDNDDLAPENFREHWELEGKDVWMFSGCRDDQTSADATISGAATGAMSWAFIGTMRENPEFSYVDVCAHHHPSGGCYCC